MKRKRWRPFRPPVITRRALAAEGWPEILDREIAELDATERRMERLTHLYRDPVYFGRIWP